MSKLRIGFCGVGAMGQAAHLRNYATLRDECEVVALAELRPRLAQRVARKYDIPRVYPSHEAMLQEEKLDGIVAAQLFTRHGTLIPQLLKAKIPVFIEKPLAGSIASARAIVEAARQSGTFVMVGYHKRCDPATIFARAEVDRLKASGEIGPMRYVRILMPAGDWERNGFFDLVHVEAGDDPAGALAQDPLATDLDQAASQRYVAFVNYYIHQINLMRHLLGEPYKLTFADKSGVLVVGESSSGVTCCIEMSPYTTTRAWEESALIAFRHGYVKLDLPAPMALNTPGQVEVYLDPPGEGHAPRHVVPTLAWDHAMRMQARAFLRAIRGQSPPPCDQSEALEDLLLAREYMRLKEGV